MDKKILIISPFPTHPPYSGNSRCILSYSEMLTEAGYNVYFFWISEYDTTKEIEEQMIDYWKDKLIIFKQNLGHRLIKVFFRYFRFYRMGYFKVDDYYPFGIKKVLLRILLNNHFDCVIVNYIFLSKIFKYITDSKKLLYTHDVFTNRYQITGNKWFSVTANEESKALNRADAILAIQENEAVFSSYLTNRIVISVYTFFKLIETPFVGSKVLLYLAGNNYHNIEAITTFIDKVFRVLIPMHPEIKMLIGGSICKVINRSLGDDSIELIGEIKDSIDFYSLGDIFINPTLSGTGLKLKSFEAMAYGKVVISHPHNTSGIYNKEQAPIIVAQSLDDYVENINFLFSHKEKIIELKNESIKYIKELNSIVKERFSEAIEN